MKNIGFIGVGNMGGPMACNLAKAGNNVIAFDISKENLNAVSKHGVKITDSIEKAVEKADVVITMLPSGTHVKTVYFNSVFTHAKPQTLMIDCSTIDVGTTRIVHEEAESKGFIMLEAPVSGGVGGAKAGILTFMAGGTIHAFKLAQDLLNIMGRNIIYCGDSGTGQAAKICNNMMLGIQMASVAEGFLLAEKLGLDKQKLFDVASTASGQCWSLTTYCPVPGPVKSSPANNNYEPGFATELMLKDMNLALDAASSVNLNLNIAEQSAKIYQDYSELGNSHKDFSGIFEQLQKYE